MKYTMIMMAVFLAGCGDASIAGRYRLTGDLHQDASLTLREAKEFDLCWNGCAHGRFNIIEIDRSRSRIELFGKGVGGKFKDILSSTSPDGYININRDDVGYDDENYIDLDIILDRGGNRIYVFTEPDIFFEKIDNL